MMQVRQEPQGFTPVTIVLETKEELHILMKDLEWKENSQALYNELYLRYKESCGIQQT